MKYNNKFYLTFIGIFIISSLYSQRDISYIMQNTNVDKLQQLAVDLKENYKAEREYALRIAKQRGLDTMNLIRIDANGRPIYAKPSNLTASIMTKTSNLRNNLGVNGEGMLVGLYEAGDNGNFAARNTHIDLLDRVTIVGSSGFSSHGTHVAGTLIGNGPDFFPPLGLYLSRGMAPEATLNSHGLGGFPGTLAEEILETGLLVSNHSWGNPGGWERDSTISCTLWSNYRQYTWLGGSGSFNDSGDDPIFGRYSQSAENIDTLLFNAPFHLAVFAAGNYDNKDPETGTFCDDDVRYELPGGGFSAYVDYDPDIHPAGNSSKTSTIGDIGNAKNILTVGNLEDDESINASSSRGKTDDGRIKPDICGNGTTLLSADSSSDIAYAEKTGTSMASPNVAGTLLLLQQAYEEQNGNNGVYMRGATLKGLAIHTATDLGFIGPDYTYGWGLLNADLAGSVIEQDATNDMGSYTSRIYESTFTPDMNSESFYFNGNSTSISKITLCYADLAGTGSDNHNETTPELVHDLDIRLYNVNTGSFVYPYQKGTEFLFPNFGDNDVDNVEQIFTLVDQTLYELRITAEGEITEDQPYSLIISGANNSCEYDISHNTDIIGSYIYRASNDITSEGTVINDRVVIYQAENKINLLPGFKAEPGSHFVANMKGCNE